MAFANLRGRDDRIEAHRITGATGDSPNAGSLSPRPRVPPEALAERGPRHPVRVPRRSLRADTPTQRITANDFEAGRIRVPSRTKALLPLRRRDTTIATRRGQ